MAQAKLQIVLEALNMASDELKAAQKQLEGVNTEAKKGDDAVKKFGEAWRTGAGVVATAAAGIYAAKRVFDFTKEGAQLEYASQKFDRLALSIGTTGDALMGDLREATRGMLSDAEIVRSAGEIMSLGLADTHDQAVRLAGVVGALGMDTNQLVLTLTNQTTMRFDALGVAVAGFDDKLQDLKDSGLSVQDAFTEAFLQQAEEQIERVGHAADTTLGSFEQLEAIAANAWDGAKQSAATFLAEGLLPIVTAYQDLFAAKDAWIQQTLREARTYEEYMALLNELPPMLQMSMAATDGLSQANYNAERALRLGGEAVDGWGASALAAGIATEGLAGGIAGVGEAATATMDDLKLMTDQMVLAAVAGSFGADQADDFRELAVQMGYLTASEAKLIEHEIKLEALRKSGVITAEQYALSVSSLNEALKDLPEEVRLRILLDIEGMADLNKIISLSGQSHLTGEGASATPQATGGPLAPVALVGENGQELIVNGMVIPNDVTEWLLRAGVVKPGKRLAGGGSLVGGDLVPQPDGIQISAGGSLVVTRREPNSGGFGRVGSPGGGTTYSPIGGGADITRVNILGGQGAPWSTEGGGGTGNASPQQVAQAAAQAASQAAASAAQSSTATAAAQSAQTVNNATTALVSSQTRETREMTDQIVEGLEAIHRDMIKPSDLQRVVSDAVARAA